MDKFIGKLIKPLQFGALVLVAFAVTANASDSKKPPVSDKHDRAPITSTPPPSCGNDSYNVTLYARNHIGWPFGDRDDRCDSGDFKAWFKHHHDHHWMGRNVYFDNLDPNLAKVTLTHESLSVDLLVFDTDDIDFDHLKVIMNSFKGVAIKKGAVQVDLIKWHWFKHRMCDKNDHHVNHDKKDNDCDDKSFPHKKWFKIVRITIHLEDYLFSVNKTAASLLQASALSSRTVSFEVTGLKHLLRVFDGELHLEGYTHHDCPTPTPRPTPTFPAKSVG